MIYCIWNGWQVIEERDESANLIAQYVWGPGIDNLLAVARDMNDDDVLEWYYVITNELSSVVAITDTAGVLKERFTYDIYGKAYRVSDGQKFFD